MTMSSKLLAAISVYTFALALPAAQAQVAPIKPGLWQIQINREAEGQKTPEMSDRLKNMPPEKRAQIEAMMKAHGMDANGITMKVCETKEMLDARNFQNPTSGCKTTYSSRTTTTWKSHTSCSELHLESDGEMTFLNPESLRSRPPQTPSAEVRLTPAT